MHKKKSTGRPVWSTCLAWLLALCLCPSCSPGQAQSNIQDGSIAAGSSAEGPEETKPDTQGPVISGVQALTVSVGGTLSYRTGVTATDDRDGSVVLQVDSSAVNLSVAGEYQVIYSAEDSAGNRTEVLTTVVVTEPEPDSEPSEPEARQVSLMEVIDKSDQILEKIIKDGMSQREKAWAIFNYVANNVKYVGTSDKSSWIIGAYDGLTTGRGDCFNYYACSKALLTRAGIPIVELQRKAGANSRHYWVLADVGQGYYHFDPCPHPKGYPLTCFLLTETQVRQYTVDLAAHSSYYIDYYTYDYDSCPVPVEGMPTGEIRPTPAPAPKPAEPGTAEPEIPETEIPEMIEPEGPETVEPESPETPGPEIPAEPDGETEGEASGSDEPAQEESPEPSEGMPSGEAADDSDNIAAVPQEEE